MGRHVASQLGKHQKAEAAAHLAARKNASKRRKSSKKTSKVENDETQNSPATIPLPSRVVHLPHIQESVNVCTRNKTLC